ncbi:MAG: hypothetical protein CV087_07340 [Candidatus Brocadia sp. WS118]|nr:MAG: hypothetical protein CV087_07340 [Candidatus Brocadia sp. WS118]
MGKDSVLGHDPLNWMKVVKETKKSASSGDVNAADQNTIRNDQPSGHQITAKQQISYPANDDKTPNIPKQSLPSDKMDNSNRTGNVSVPKQKIAIGRLYEKPSAEKIKSTPPTEGVFQESKPYPEPSIPTSRRVPQIQRNEPEIHRVPFSVSAERTTTYIIVAYTALLLILGYFVYTDLSKRTSKIEARLFAIEKALRSKQH